MSTSNDSPKIFVTTYNAYNGGKQFERGQWVDLSEFTDLDELTAHCREIYDNESDPEFMVTDYEGFPRAWYSESGLPDEKHFSLIQGYANADDQDAIDAFLACTSDSFDDWDELESKFQDCFMGEFRDAEDFAYDYVEQVGMLHNVDETIKRYFDYEAFGRDLMMDISEHDGYYFDLNR